MRPRLWYLFMVIVTGIVLLLINIRYLTLHYRNVLLQVTLVSTERQQKLAEFRRKFSKVKIDAYLPPTTGYRTVTYRCYTYCGGFGDRVKGIITAYMLALLTGRRFAIKMNYPLDIIYFLMPNIYDWRLPDSVIQRSQLTINRITDDSPGGMHLNMSEHNFSSSWGPYDNVQFESNLDDTLALLENPYFQQQVRDLNLKPTKADRDKLVSLVYEILFAPTTVVTEKVNNALKIVHRSGLTLICMHIRIGKNPTIPKDDFIFNRSSIANDMVNFVDKNLTRDGDPFPFIFVTSDSDEVVARIKQHYSGRSLSLEGPIVHVDRFDNSSNKVVYDGYLKAVADFYMLGNCDTSILSYSGYSLQANLRRINPYKNLYLYCRGIHKIENSNWTLPFKRC